MSSTFFGPSAATWIGIRSRAGWSMILSGLPSPVPCPSASGISYDAPWCTSRSRRHTERQISMISRVRPTGWSNATPWKPSITCGPDAPMPRTHLPFESLSTPTAVMASSEGVRVNRGRMLDPIWALSVTAARNPIFETASALYASPVRRKSTPAASSACARRMYSSGRSPMPTMAPIFIGRRYSGQSGATARRS